MISAEPLSPAETRLLAAIAENPGGTQQDLATAMRVSPRHVRRLLSRERVRRALDDAARAGLREATSLLGRAAVRAARSLSAMAGGDVLPTNAGVAACRAVLENARLLIDLDDLAARVEALETRPPAPPPPSGEDLQ